MTGVAHIYSQFSDIVFKPLSKTNKVPRISIIIDIGDKTLFGLYINNHLSLAEIIADIFKFLHEIYFLHIAFGLVYLTGKKIFVFNNKLNILGFKKGLIKDKDYLISIKINLRTMLLL